MLSNKRSWIIMLVGVGLTLIAAGLSPFLMVSAQDPTPEVTPEAVIEAAPEATAEATIQAAAEATLEALYPVPSETVTITGDNSYCLICHNQVLRVFPLPDGSTLDLYVDPAMIAASVHGAGNPNGTLGCVDCHGEHSFPHDQLPPTTRREATVRAVAICSQCHTERLEELESGYHTLAVRAGNYDAAVCTDCHGAHNVQSPEVYPELVAVVCGKCHESTLNEWNTSPHSEIGDLGCSTCHSPHSQRIRVGETTTDLCLNCHETTDIENVLVHQQHVLTREDPVACVDCHMDNEVSPLLAATSNTPLTSTGHTMFVEAVSCTTCHEDFVAAGLWDGLTMTSASEDASATAEPAPRATPAIVATPENAEIVEAVRVSEDSGYVQLLQGLILGLGFGATATAVFVTRGNRDRKPANENTAAEDEKHES